MKNPFIKFKANRILRIGLILTVILYCKLYDVQAQQLATLIGKLADKANNESIPYANVGLFNAADSKLIHGLVSDTSGSFAFSGISAGNYILKASMIGYDPVAIEINIADNTPNNTGTIFMNQNTINLGETFITADLIKGRSEKDRTAYFVTRKMSESSNNGLDIVKLVPGVQVDLMRNISIDGSQRILLLVDGKERDKNFLSQIIPDQIEKIEILNAPPAGYDGDVTGVMNIVTKKDKNSGLSGQINLEMPIIPSFYYLHPDYNISFVYKKLNFFSSYNGEMIRFDQQESILRRIKAGDVSYKTRSDQFVIQKTWSHHFHYGVDYAINPKSRFSFYGFYNPYSQEYDGRAQAVTEMNDNGPWETLRNTEDINRSVFYSLFYKRILNDMGGEFTMEASNYQLHGKNTATYDPISDESAVVQNMSKPFQNALSIKADLSIPLQHNLSMSSGVRFREYQMEERIYDDFRYTGDVYSVYASLAQTLNRFDWKLGMRAEKSVSDLKNTFRQHYLNFLPSVSIGYKINADKTLKFVFSNSVNRPNIYQLNPNISTDDPYTIRKGNPSLDPEIHTALFVEYSQKMKSNFASIRLFYSRTGNAINYLTTLNDTSVFEIQTGNFGTIHQTGCQFSGTFKIGRMITFIPYLRIYAQFTDGNSFAKSFAIRNRNQVVVEPGFSSLISMKHDFNIGMTFQYGSPRNSITGNNFGDPIYMVSLDKGFKNGFKLGIVSGLPFSKTVTYQGSEMNIDDLYSRYSGDIHFSKPLLWLKISYQFHSGKRTENQKRSMEDIDAVPKKTGL